MFNQRSDLPLWFDIICMLKIIQNETCLYILNNQISDFQEISSSLFIRESYVSQGLEKASLMGGSNGLDLVDLRFYLN